MLLDEVDLVLHPLKSELNFPMGEKFALDVSEHGERWGLPIHLLDALFHATSGNATSFEMRGLAAELQAARGERDLSVIDLSAVLEASPAFVCALSPQGRVTGWNAAAAAMTGYSRDAMVHQHLVEACVPEAAQQAVADHMEHVFALPPSDPLASEPGEAFS